jgi:hypothetical protein
MAASMVVRLVAQKERSLAFLTAVRKAPLLADLLAGQTAREMVQ